MQSTQKQAHKSEELKFPPFDLKRLVSTIFAPQKGEKVCILIDLDHPEEVIDLAFLKNKKHAAQIKAHDIFYRGFKDHLVKEFGLVACDFYAYKATGGSNLELPDSAWTPEGKQVSFQKDIYPKYNLIFAIGDYSATAPLTATAKKFGFRGSTMHGVNDVILKSGLSVDYNQVSKDTEKLRSGMTKADHVDIDFEAVGKKYHLHIDLGKQEAQKSHGICHKGPDIVNLPAGEVYFVPKDAKGSFPIKFEEDGTIGLMHVEHGKINKVELLKGNAKTVDKYQHKFSSDPSTGYLGELGFGTQVLPYSGGDIQDEKIFGTFHIATGRNDHLNGSVTLDKFRDKHNATHDDILFSSTKTPEIKVLRVSMHRHGKDELLIENYQPCSYLLGLLK